MNKSTVTSKGQVTIPKEIRDILNLDNGDVLLFEVNDKEKTVTFRKELDFIDCLVCKNDKRRIKKVECPICKDKKVIQKNKDVMEEIFDLMSDSRKYGIGISLISQERDKETGQVITRTIPQINIFADTYPDEWKEILHDYLQKKLIEKYAPKSVSELNKYKTPTDLLLKEILSLVIKKETKREVFEWFRGEKTVFELKKDKDSLNEEFEDLIK